MVDREEEKTGKTRGELRAERNARRLSARRHEVESFEPLPSIIVPPAPAPETEAPPQETKPAKRKPAHAKRRTHSRLIRYGSVCAAGIIIAGIGLAGWVRASAPLPLASVTATSAVRSIHLPLKGFPTMPWPLVGQAAVAIPTLGYSASSGRETAVPVASLTKIMTAYVVLHDHPLAVGESGPSITIDAADAADYATDTTTDQSSILIQQGEVLNESQLLEGLLVHSASDFAFILATWDAGTLAAFVAHMNSTAKILGMRDTHFADASGFTPGSQSTASDLLVVTSAAMANPVFKADVAHVSVTLPVSGISYTFTPLLTGFTTGVHGVIGVKSGLTTQAGGCDVMAYTSPTTHTIVLAAVTGQTGPTGLSAAGHIALGLAQSIAGALHKVVVVHAGERVGSVVGAGTTVAATVSRAIEVVMLPGERASVALDPDTVRDGAKAGTVVGSFKVISGNQQISEDVIVGTRVPAPSLWTRLL